MRALFCGVFVLMLRWYACLCCVGACQQPPTTRTHKQAHVYAQNKHKQHKHATHTCTAEGKFEVEVPVQINKVLLLLLGLLSLLLLLLSLLYKLTAVATLSFICGGNSPFSGNLCVSARVSAHVRVLVGMCVCMCVHTGGYVV